jgi:hypothetical protein
MSIRARWPWLVSFVIALLPVILAACKSGGSSGY